MKKIVALLVVICASAAMAFSVSAQNFVKPNEYYIEIYEISLMGGKSVCLDFGRDAGISQSYKIMDENQKPIEFKTVVAALNYLSARGWQVVTVYDRVMKVGTRTFYLMKYDAAKNGNNQITDAIDEVLKEF